MGDTSGHCGFSHVFGGNELLHQTLSGTNFIVMQIKEQCFCFFVYGFLYLTEPFASVLTSIGATQKSYF